MTLGAMSFNVDEGNWHKRETKHVETMQALDGIKQSQMIRSMHMCQNGWMEGGFYAPSLSMARTIVSKCLFTTLSCHKRPGHFATHAPCPLPTYQRQLANPRSHQHEQLALPKVSLP